jgi:ATP-dependent RNA helicase DbpA
MPDNFSALGLRNELQEALERLAYQDTTPIQAQALPHILAGADVAGQAKTGSGKTAGFGLGLLNGLDPERPHVHAMVLCPTRELADQVAGELRRLAQCMPNTRVVVLCGGRRSHDQRLALAQGAQVVVGTPGRVADHLRRGTLDLSGLSVLVLDEADRMLDMGFMEEVDKIIAACPSSRQTLLFSATYPDEIKALSNGVQRDAVAVSVSTRVEGDLLRQLVFKCEPKRRRGMVARLLARYRPESALIFCETRSDCDGMADFLRERGASVMALHGGMEQRDRDDVLLRFGNGSLALLVATNVAARGLDISGLPAVIIAELSPDAQSHIHRIGRTGRAGDTGLALSVVAGPKEAERLLRIEELMNGAIKRGPKLDPAHSLAFLVPANQTILILSGRKQKLRKGDVMGALVKDCGLSPDVIGRIDLMDATCAVAVQRDHAAQALNYLGRGKVKKQRVRAVMLD